MELVANPFAALLPPGTDPHVAVWAETVFWRGIDGSATKTGARLGVSERTVRRRIARFVAWMRRSGCDFGRTP